MWNDSFSICVMFDLWCATDTLMLVIMNYRNLLRIKSHSETLQIHFLGSRCVYEGIFVIMLHISRFFCNTFEATERPVNLMPVK